MANLWGTEDVIGPVQGSKRWTDNVLIIHLFDEFGIYCAVDNKLIFHNYDLYSQLNSRYPVRSSISSSVSAPHSHGCYSANR